jgi:hypothetical protein
MKATSYSTNNPGNHLSVLLAKEGVGIRTECAPFYSEILRRPPPAGEVTQQEPNTLLIHKKVCFYMISTTG